MPKRTKKYEESLIKELKNPKEAAEYLNVHLEDGEKDSEALFLLALRDVAKAYGIMHVAKGSDLGRESLYKTLSKKGNPKLKTLRALLDTVGLKLIVQPKAG
ncbi:MAG: putative addiction module antidote protein [Bdellovibrionales bacterium]|nr:putative addiction module antidote protein [Bdellovibrionales bacterium]